MRITALIALLVAVVSGAGWIAFIRSISSSNVRQAEVSRVASQSVSLYADGLQMCQATRNILLDPAHPAAWTNFDAASKQFSATADGLAADLNKLFPDSAISREMPAIKADHERHLEIQRRVHDAAKSSNFEEGKRILNGEETPLWRKYKKRILDLRGQLERVRAAESAAMEDACRGAQLLSWITSAMLILTGLLTLMASGRASGRLSQVISVLSSSVCEIKLAAAQVARTSQTLASGATQQAASVEEITASALEVKEKAGENRANSESASGVVTEWSGRLEQTNRALDDAVTAIGEIDRSTSEIAKIIKMIDDIAFQTNILALNAAVEAARAGEAGLGFSVVAEEVRNLARRCAEAARDTSNLIESSILKSHDGKARVTRVAGEIHDYMSSSDQMKQLVRNVSEGSSQQAQSIEQIVRSLSHISEAAQMAAASAEEGASAASELDAQTKGLEDLVDSLTIAISGKDLRGQHRDASAHVPRRRDKVIGGR